LLIISLGAVTILGCARRPVDVPSRQGPHVLLIIVDTLRADKLGCYGSTLGATPRIDALAAGGTRFEAAYSHAPWTLPACASLFTSRYPFQHGAGGRVPDFTALRPDVHTLAECFRDAGFETAGVVNVDFLGPSFGLTRGLAHVDFEAYADNEHMRDAARTTDAALRWLDQGGRGKFFLVVHYFDPHLVYAPPAEQRRRFAAPQDRDDASWVFGTRRQIGEYRSGTLSFDEATIRRAERLYDGEVAYVDQEVGRLLDELERRELRGATLVVLTADHGEEFLDHGGFEHGHTLYNELVHVPLIFSWPGRIPAATVSLPVAHVDVAPTLCALVGVAGDSGFVGRDLSAAVRGETAPAADATILFHGNFWGSAYRGLYRDGYKLIAGPDRVELYDLRYDPHEQFNLSDADASRRAALLSQLDAAMSALAGGSAGTSRPAVQLSPEERARLKSLGYGP